MMPVTFFSLAYADGRPGQGDAVPTKARQAPQARAG